jgi:hypothetical protein
MRLYRCPRNLHSPRSCRYSFYPNSVGLAVVAMGWPQTDWRLSRSPVGGQAFLTETRRCCECVTYSPGHREHRRYGRNRHNNWDGAVAGRRPIFNVIERLTTADGDLARIISSTPIRADNQRAAARWAIDRGGAGLGTMWGQELATPMLADAGFTEVNIAEVDSDPFNNYYIARK